VVKRSDNLDGSEPAGEAVTHLVESQGGRLYALGMRFCGNREEAEDLVQETFMQAFRKWEQFQGRSSAATWLYTIASRICQRLHRKKSGEPAQLESLEAQLPFGDVQMAVVPDDQDGPLAQQIREEGRREIEAAIAELPLEFRMPLVLKEIVGFRLSEIANILDLKEATVKTRVHRARLRIRKALESALPKKAVPAPVYSKQVCLDLLQAKQDTLDRGLDYEFPASVLCERCEELFATLDLALDVCHDIARGELPERLRRALLEQLK
jgi:RNA polymerase sigma-70 factor (ECF subfamily)